MANSLKTWWQKIGKSPPYQRAKLFARRVIGKEPWLRPDTKCRVQSYGDWMICPDGLDSGGIVYSLGVGRDIGFDLALVRDFGLNVHAFDPTPGTGAWLDGQELADGFSFHPWAVAGTDGSLTLYPRVKRDGTRSKISYTFVAEDSSRDHGIDVPALTFSTIMARLGHDSIRLLKIDIEGAEYEVLDGLLAASARPDQLLIEFHHRFAGLGKEKTAAMIQRLRAVGYRIFAISITGREFSLIHTAEPG